MRLRKPVVSASILAFDGQISTFVPFEGPCYRCLYPTPPPAEMAPSCGAAGVLGVMAGVMGLLQANEVIKLAAGIGEPLIGRLLLYEALGTRFTELKVRRDPDCPVCGETREEIPSRRWASSPTTSSSAPARVSAARKLRRRMPTIKIPPILRQQTGGESESRPRRDRRRCPRAPWPRPTRAPEEQLFADDGELNRYVNVYLNDEDVRVLGGLDTEVADADTVVILPAMAGGASALVSGGAPGRP